MADLVTAIKAQKQGEQWAKDGGRFIPHPATWLNQARWEDEASAAPEPPADPNDPNTPHEPYIPPEIEKEMNDEADRRRRILGIPLQARDEDGNLVPMTPAEFEDIQRRWAEYEAKQAAGDAPPLEGA